MSYLLLVLGVSYFVWRYLEYRGKKKGPAQLTDEQLDARAVQIIAIAGKAALNASSEATQQFHREHPERCYAEEGRLFSDEYLRIGEAAERSAYAEILDIALSSSDTRLAAAIRRNDCGSNSAAMSASYQRHDEISIRLRRETA
jgi:hypothetical protein